MKQQSNRLVHKVRGDLQNRNSPAWKRLCEYVEQVAADGTEEFSPLEALGQDLFQQIHTLPESISRLKKVKKVWLYGSMLTQLPPEIGQMEALEEFDPYTSYYLHWYPYEITNCKNLKASRVSTRALYGNYKNRMPFPNLRHNPVRYTGETLKCSICNKEITYAQTNQFWISLRVGTDMLPLLVNVCSVECENKIPQSPKGFVSGHHKGGSAIQIPTFDEWSEANTRKISLKDMNYDTSNEPPKNIPVLQVIRKIWDKFGDTSRHDTDAREK
ncbi:leucine-rich repeat domain-containing protein [Dawidia soli]|uniref:Leucine-rich repeat domain-containing protein n=1 Tax=Dawidia soli TaxID=2782352 RepID=A0AAP2DET0_9BACT|nr:leucine-rich repeat domain-containing protein [Dawidia soli]MBT1689395.1 leucine-rich repeat domain-containing protein [Dawidia soli]